MVYEVVIVIEDIVNINIIMWVWYVGEVCCCMFEIFGCEVDEVIV